MLTGKRLLDELINVASELKRPDLVNKYKEAKTKSRFKDAVSEIELPDRLCIDGQNLLSLLYKELSSDVHSASDADFLSKATYARSLLEHLFVQIDEVLSNEREIREAMNALNPSKDKK